MADERQDLDLRPGIRDTPGTSGARSVDPRPGLSVCLRCAPPGWTGTDAQRPGARLANAIEAEAARRGEGPGPIRDVRCMSQCKRPCVVAFSGEGRFTYLFGDLDPETDAADVLDAFALYGDRPDGHLERAERPRALRRGMLGRVPPLIIGARYVEPRPPATPSSPSDRPASTAAPGPDPEPGGTRA